MNEITITTGQDILPMDLMQRAIATGADPVVLEKLMGLHERWEATRAHKAYAAAMADAKAEFGKISKSNQVDYTTNRGRTRYKFEDLTDISDAIDAPLSKHGLSYRWRTISENPASVTVTCIISHRDGYSEENSLTSAPDITGNKNSTQALGSAVTYLQRYTLKAALGLTASEDDDGSTAGQPKPPAAAAKPTIDAPAPAGPPEQPYQLVRPILDGTDEEQATAWREWCARFVGHARASGSIEEVDHWLSENFDTLKLLTAGYPKMYRNLEDAVSKQRGVLEQMEPRP